MITSDGENRYDAQVFSWVRIPHPRTTPSDELRSLQVPTLLIFGDRDFSPLPDVVEMFGLMPDAQLAVLPGTTHIGVTRRPGEVLALITPFPDGR